MKKIHFNSVVISATIVWSLGVLAYVSSDFVQIIEDHDLQANWVLSIALIPAASLGAHIYYRKGHETNGFLLVISIFSVVMVLDAIFTVPLIIIPYGGN